MATATDTLPHAAVQPDAKAKPWLSLRLRASDDSDDDLDLLEITDGLERDRTAIRQIYLALWGLKDHGADPADLDAVSGLIIALEERLEKRRDQVELLREVEAQRDDGSLSPRRPTLAVTATPR
jgi:hypothetical protein